MIIKLRITNWEKYKPRKDIKNPSWFPMDNRLIEQKQFAGFTAEEILVWIQCLSFASIQGTENIDFNTNYLTCYLNTPELCQISAIKKLCRHGHLSKIRTRSVRNPYATEQNRTEQYPLNPPRGTDAPPGSKNLLLLTAWNVNRGSLPEAKALSTRRMRLADARLREEPDLAAWESVVKRIAASRFCTGHNDRNWVATFDWLLAPDTRLKVLEGKYDNRKAPSTIAPPPPGKQIAMDTKLK